MPPRLLLLALTAVALAAVAFLPPPPSPLPPMPRVAVAPDGRGFVLAPAGRPFTPWGANYGHDGKLLEDFWERDWPTLAADFRDLKALGANVVRVHLQFGKFMDATDRPNAAALARLGELLTLAERTGLYLDLTGLGSYRPADVPVWYDALDEAGRWAAQARFWGAVARRCAGSPAVFCYDLMNEPVVPGEKRKPGAWLSGKPLGGYDFVQFVTLDPAGRPRGDIARAWIRTLTAAIRGHDPRTPITVGLLPPIKGWGYFSGFVPAEVAAEVDFVSVHLYPAAGKTAEALADLKGYAVGKPLVVEETFPLACPSGELREFLLKSRGTACGWLGHYDGRPPAWYDERRRAGTLTVPEALWSDWLTLFRDLRGEMVAP